MCSPVHNSKYSIQLDRLMSPVMLGLVLGEKHRNSIIILTDKKCHLSFLYMEDLIYPSALVGHLIWLNHMEVLKRHSTDVHINVY